MIGVEVVVAEAVAEVRIITTTEDETAMQRAVEIMGEDAETIAALVEGVEMVEEVEDGDAVEVVEETIAVQVLEIIALVIEHKMNLTHFKEKLTIEVRYTKNCK